MKANPPAGEVIFLFTDIEGSTRRWEQHPAAMRAALARHDAIVRGAIEEHGGYVFQVIGDAFCAAFGDASAALAAVAQAQRSLHKADWGDLGELKVRMALHSGPGEPRDGGYFAPQALNRLSRILKVTHGGQTLLSAAIQAQLIGWPADVTLRDLGLRRLRDLAQAERLFQVVTPDLPSEFPPLETLDARAHNLPLPPTSLLGRETEVATLRALLRQPDVRLVTLTGPGGTGKTRLTLEVAADLIDEYEDGVYFVALGAINDAALVASAIAQTLGLQESAGESLVASLKAYLGERQMLLALDNFEQVVVAAPLVAELLTAAPHLKIIISSRTVLRVAGEREFAVPPLALPRSSVSADEAAQYAAVALFVQRAQAVRPDFALSEDNAAIVAEICQRLDGLPLAIELAAARVKLFPPQALLARLNERLKLLTSAMRDVPERQRSLRGAIDWSYNLLSDEEKQLFRRLAVFVGGFSGAAVAMICGDNPDPNPLAQGAREEINSALNTQHSTLDLLTVLADKSLLHTIPADHVAVEAQGDAVGEAESRFVMLDTIREYALEKLASSSGTATRYTIQKSVREFAAEELTASGEEQMVRERHATYYLALAEAAEQQLRGPQQIAWLARLEQEHDSLRAALDWTLTQGETEMALRFGGALWWFWFARGYLSEGRRWLERTLSTAGGEKTAILAKALAGAGGLARGQGDYVQAYSYQKQALAIEQELGDKPGIGKALGNLGLVCWDLGDHVQARTLQEQSLIVARELGEQQSILSALGNLGLVALEQSDYPAAKSYFGQAIEVSEEIGDKWGVAASLSNLGLVVYQEHDYAAAQSLYEQGLAIFKQLDAKTDISISLTSLANVVGRQGDNARARSLYEECISIERMLGNKLNIAGSLEGLAAITIAEGRPKQAARLFGAAEALRKAIGAPLSSYEQADYNNDLDALRSQLDSTALTTTWAEGRAMTVEQAVDYALKVAP